MYENLENILEDEADNEESIVKTPQIKFGQSNN